MKTFARLLFAFVIFAGIELPRLAAADDLSDADRQAIQSMIAHQLEAFQHDDGATAYSFASPALKTYLPSVDVFMSMVRNGYQPVYRARDVTFGQVQNSPSGPTQKVFLTGPDGKGYVALYSLQKQPDGSWRINGCVLVEDKGATI